MMRLGAAAADAWTTLEAAGVEVLVRFCVWRSTGWHSELTTVLNSIISKIIKDDQFRYNQVIDLRISNHVIITNEK